MGIDNQFDDVYKSLLEIISNSVRQVLLKEQMGLITKQPALAAIMAKALQEYTPIAEQELAIKQDPPPDRPAQDHPLPRATWVRNMVFDPDAIHDLAPNRKQSVVKLVQATHSPISSENCPAMMLTQLLLAACFGLCLSNKALWGLVQRMGVPEAALR